MALEPIRPPWLARRRRRKVDTISIALTKSELHAYAVALYTTYQLSLSDGRLVLR